MDVLTTVVDTLVWLVLFRTSAVVMTNRRERIIKGLLNESVYDNRIPPNYEDNFPTDVTIQVFILSFDSVTEASMVTYEGSQARSLPYTATGSGSTPSGYQPPRFDYSATIFLREHWEDRRLRWGDDLSRFASRCNDDDDDDDNDDNSNDNALSANCSDTTSARHQDASSEDKDDKDDDTEEVEEEILERLELDSKLLEMVWMPDLYFLNDKEAHIHDVTTANRMLHIYRNGTIRTSSRISMTLSCDMYLEKYPHDEQNCSMLLASCELRDGFSEKLTSHHLPN